MKIVVDDKINRICFKLNERAKDFEEKIFQDKIKLFEKISKLSDKNIINIFELSKNDFLNYIKGCFEFCGKTLGEGFENINNKIINIIQTIINGKIINYIDTRNYDYICKSYDIFIESKYRLKEQSEKTLEKFKEEVNEFIIKPIFYSQNNYAMIEIYDLIINTLLNPLIDKYNNYLERTKTNIKKYMLLILEENYMKFNKNLNLNEIFNNNY